MSGAVNLTRAHTSSGMSTSSVEDHSGVRERAPADLPHQSLPGQLDDHTAPCWRCAEGEWGLDCTFLGPCTRARSSPG